MGSLGRERGSKGDEVQKTQSQPEAPRDSLKRGRCRNHSTSSLPFLNKYLEKLGVDSITASRIMQSTWRKTTIKSYSNYLRRWDKFCKANNIKPLKPKLCNVLRFLRGLEDEGLGYNSLNSARSALSIILPRNNGVSVGKNHVIVWYLKSVFEKRPPQAKYVQTWDVQMVFNMLEKWQDNCHLSLKELSCKVAILILLVSGCRGHILVSLTLKNAIFDRNMIILCATVLERTARQGDPLSSIKLQAYPWNSKLCVVQAVNDYIERTKNVRNSKNLLVSFVKPYCCITKDTLSRWILYILDRADIDTKRYSLHSTRAAMAASALKAGISVQNVMSHVGWKSARTFAVHYNKKVEKVQQVAEKVISGMRDDF